MTAAAAPTRAGLLRVMCSECGLVLVGNGRHGAKRPRPCSRCTHRAWVERIKLSPSYNRKAKERRGEL